MASNPLLEIHFRIPFDKVRAEHVEPAVTELIRGAQERLDAIGSSGGPRTYRSTLGALDDATEGLDYAIGIVRHLESVATYPELRAAYNAIQPAVSAFFSRIPLDAALWEAIKEFAGTEEARSLQAARKRHLKKTLDFFRRHGADLDAAGKKRLEEIDVELATLTTRYSQNVLDSTNAFELVVTEEASLAGLPPTAIAAARQAAQEKGCEGWRFTLQQPSYFAVMTYLDDPRPRERMYRAYSTRATSGGHDNRPALDRVLELRREKAKLLGFRHFADFVLEDRMAHTGARAQSFLRDLHARTAKFFARENQELVEFRRGEEGPGAPEPAPWDVAYYAEKLRRALYDFDEETLRPYFPLEQVVAGMFEIAGRLFGVRITEENAVPLWHADVRYYNIHDTGGARLGSFYADWYPRETKRGGAWMDAFITGKPAPGGGFTPHLGTICGNLNPPIGDKPALLTHRDVETIFHEFGHLLHHVLSRVEVRGLSGTNVAWDFVELPSQIMENWCWEREALDLFSRHWETGETIPEDLFRKMRRARTFRSANAMMRQLGFGVMDLALHIDYSHALDGDVVEYSRRITQEFSPARLPGDHAAIASFTHLFSSPVAYAAGYYSYKWAEVLDADAFTRFKKEGIFSETVGREFRRAVLARGDSEDPGELYREFMGRDPQLDALLERAGLTG